ncbi:MAG TPA: cyclase family protein [Anaerolinea thermolimosa]|uniref:Cyclase family protein n=1 Tax=Anaerolinea thermolimosa TaxID=229919 RepID=A0A3D1JDE7_9CHLR|nr:cyclase family protein [Anaerolinea thermolimosa]GAP08194.1 predicted metal-dependent hydrolase [Anaerolinea thermolimosa]HCE16523.1 cyclase family protein [Anaerolinea thermolimosa]
MPTLSFTSFIELHHSLHAGVPVWPGDPPIQISDHARLEREGYFLRRLNLGEHSGTHLNAPAHFLPQGLAVDQLPPERLVLPAVVIDVHAACAVNADFALPLEEVHAWEREHGRVPSGSLVILFTGWEDRWDAPIRYWNGDSEGRLHFPGFSLESARYLIEECGAAGLASDGPGLEPGLDEAFSVNRYLLERNALALENLCRVDRLPASGATLVIGLLRIEGGSGAPVTILAFLP